MSGVYVCQMTGGTGCPSDPEGQHCFAHLNPESEVRLCIDCGELEVAS